MDAGSLVNVLQRAGSLPEPVLGRVATQVSFMGDAKSSLGDAESSLGDAESSLGDAESSLGDAKSSLGDAESSLISPRMGTRRTKNMCFLSTARVTGYTRGSYVNSSIKHLNYRSPAHTGRTNKGKN
jgi:hypothetical protein